MRIGRNVAAASATTTTATTIGLQCRTVHNVHTSARWPAYATGLAVVANDPQLTLVSAQHKSCYTTWLYGQRNSKNKRKDQMEIEEEKKKFNLNGERRTANAKTAESTPINVVCCECVLGRIYETLCEVVRRIDISMYLFIEYIVYIGSRAH